MSYTIFFKSRIVVEQSISLSSNNIFDNEYYIFYKLVPCEKLHFLVHNYKSLAWISLNRCT